MQNFLTDIVRSAQRQAAQEFEKLVAQLDRQHEDRFELIIGDMKREVDRTNKLVEIPKTQSANPRLDAGRQKRQSANQRLDAAKQKTAIKERVQKVDNLIGNLKKMLGPHYKDSSTHRKVAARLREVAILIGARQEQESIMISGEKAIPRFGVNHTRNPICLTKQRRLIAVVCV